MNPGEKPTQPQSDNCCNGAEDQPVGATNDQPSLAAPDAQPVPSTPNQQNLQFLDDLTQDIDTDLLALLGQC